MTLTELRTLLRGHGGKRILYKVLAANDNSKNQIYLGMDFSVINVLPFTNIRPERSGGGARTRRTRRRIFKASLDFSWLTPDGNACTAPHAQIILYPQYPEVRLSSLLRGCRQAPSTLIRSRTQGRVLFLGLTRRGRVLGYVVPPSDPLAVEVLSVQWPQQIGVFTEIPMAGRESSRSALVRELRRIHTKGWITGKRLRGGKVISYHAPNAGGYTLEAELGVSPSGEAAPDFLDWEVKSHEVSSFDSFAGARITLMTPEPTGGYYVTNGALAFIQRYGYPAQDGTRDRLNFNGLHYVDRRHPKTGLTLELRGYSEQSGLTDADGGICLICDQQEVAAKWSFHSLMEHWTRKHARAVYVPHMKRVSRGKRQYRYGPLVRLAEGTDFLRFLKAMKYGLVYYDPGLKAEGVSTTSPRVKRRSQFRMKSSDIAYIYASLSEVDVRR